jgi:ABC-type glycerol-3-phosphate transport system permease component
MKTKERRRKKTLTFGINPKRIHKSQFKFYAYLIPIALVMMLPMIYIFVTAFKPIDELFAYPPRFYVKNPTFDNFRKLFEISSSTAIPASRYLFNTLIITVLRIVGNVVLSVCVGFVLSKKRFRGKNTLLQINTASLMFISAAVAIPTYFVVIYTGLGDNFLANIIPALVAPTGVFLTKQFLDQIPNALIEAAIIDGASDYRIIRKIIYPLVKPALATVTILSFQSAWSDVTASALYIDNETLKTFAYYMSTLSANAGNSVAGQGIGAAGTLIMFVPNLIIFIILQASVMNTMAHSGIK